jgi:NAD(P)-dependent dehydrogenase (short-subunit alcohol dehydrogenase family)
LIIGGSSGIGKALAERYSESDYDVDTAFNNAIPERTPSTGLIKNPLFRVAILFWFRYSLPSLVEEVICCVQICSFF